MEDELVNEVIGDMLYVYPKGKTRFEGERYVIKTYHDEHGEEIEKYEPYSYEMEEGMREEFESDGLWHDVDMD